MLIPLLAAMIAAGGVVIVLRTIIRGFRLEGTYATATMFAGGDSGGSDHCDGGGHASADGACAADGGGSGH